MQQPWNPRDATLKINSIAKNLNCDFAFAKHVTDRLRERGLIMSDLMFVLKQGFVYENPEPSTVQGLYKYKVEGRSPNSGSRFLRVVVVPDEKSCQIKSITIMWRDEH